MKSITRRQFLGSTAAGTAVLSQLGSLATAADTPPDHKLRLGLIGCGWYGMVDVEAAFKVGGVEVVALCDVDSGHLGTAADKVEKLQGKRPQTFKLHEELLQAPGLEALIIATPPHWHALPFIAAMERGLDVYCEKPLAYDVREGRAMVDAAGKSGRVVQIGFQRRQNASFQAVRQHILDGQAGRIISAEPQIHYTAGTADPTPQDPPPGLDWDRWCGPAPKIPYSPQVGHMNWRLEKTTGQGHLVDWGIHLIDATRVILGLGMPQTISASGGLYGLKGKITTPDVFSAHFEFDACPVIWRHHIWGAEEFAPDVSNGIFFYGEKETIFATDDHWTVIPRGKNKERQEHAAPVDAGTLHMADFLAAVRSRRQPVCLIEDAFRSTATVKLAMIAYDTGTKITWEDKAQDIVGNPAASALLRREYRAPWKHPSPA